MANLDDRGQIILVAAFALAVIFIALALIVNSAIFTENLASRGETSGSDGALSMRANIEASAGSNLDRINRECSSCSHSTLESDMDNSIDEISTQIGGQQAKSGRIVSVDGPVDRTDGIRISQNDPSTDPLASSSSIDVADDVSRVGSHNGTRAFRIQVTDMSATSSSNGFGITATDSNGDSWETTMWQESGEIVVQTTRDGLSNDYYCRVDPDNLGNFQIDVTDGTIDNKACPALRQSSNGDHLTFSSGESSTYDIDFTNPDLVDGEYSLVTNANSAPDAASKDALYDVRLEYEYATSDFEYETEIRVAPGEPDV